MDQSYTPSGSAENEKGQGHEISSYVSGALLISPDTLLIIDIICSRIIHTSLALFGLVTNSFNILVLRRQGFSDAFNISLLGLTIADVGALITVLWSFVYNHPLLNFIPNIPFTPYDMVYMTSGSIHLYFQKTVCALTIFITIQRCMCVSMPLKVGTLMTPHRTGLIIIAIYVIYFLLTVFILHSSGAARLDWRFNVRRNRSVIGVVMTSYFTTVSDIYNMLHTVLQLLLFAVVIISTAILVIQLRQKSEWRRSSTITTGSENIDSISKRDQRLGHMVICLSGIQILCFLPTSVTTCCSLVIPEFNLGRQQEKALFVTWSLTSLLETVNSSVTFFVYYFMSSKFRSTFRQLSCLPGIHMQEKKLRT